MESIVVSLIRRSLVLRVDLTTSGWLRGRSARAISQSSRERAPCDKYVLYYTLHLYMALHLIYYTTITGCVHINLHICIYFTNCFHVINYSKSK